MPARLINIKYITIRAEKVASPVTALQRDFRTFSITTSDFGIIMDVSFIMTTEIIPVATPIANKINKSKLIQGGVKTGKWPL